MPPLAIMGAVSAGSSLLGGLLGKSAAQSAAEQQQAAAAKASGIAGAAGQQAQNALTGQIANENTNVQPYLQAGAQATNQLSSALAPGGSLTQQFGQFQAPTAAQAAAMPGYQFQLQQGQNALQNSAAARGGLLSTGTAKALDQYSQGFASTDYGNLFNQALQGYQTNFNTFNTQQNEAYQRLAGLSGQGAASAAGLNNVQQQGTNALASSLMGTAQQQGQDIMGGANAGAAGTVGGTNALVGGLTGAANAIGGGLSLNAILGAQNGSNTYVPSVANGSFSYAGGNTPGTGFTPAPSGAGLWGNTVAPPTAPDFGNALPAVLG
jgi:hypothetical protein